MSPDMDTVLPLSVFVPNHGDLYVWYGRSWLDPQIYHTLVHVRVGGVLVDGNGVYILIGSLMYIVPTHALYTPNWTRT